MMVLMSFVLFLSEIYYDVTGKKFPSGKTDREVEVCMYLLFVLWGFNF